MRMRWDTLTFLHWSYEPDVVRRHLPAGLDVETWDGRAWVGLVPFEMQVRPPTGPGVMTFPETNVRTYVVGPDGRPGVWFFSLDAGSVAAVTTARATWQLPYFASTMSVERAGGEIHYRSRRRWPGRAEATHDITVAPGDPLERVSEFDNYLTARFTLWNAVAGRLMRTQAEHPPWVLQSARVEKLDETLVVAAGLPAPSGDPLVHFSTGTDVRVGAPRPVPRRAALRTTAAAASG